MRHASLLQARGLRLRLHLAQRGRGGGELALLHLELLAGSLLVDFPQALELMLLMLGQVVLLLLRQLLLLLELLELVLRVLLVLVLVLVQQQLQLELLLELMLLPLQYPLALRQFRLCLLHL